jgi:hypothetical protein
MTFPTDRNFVDETIGFDVTSKRGPAPFLGLERNNRFELWHHHAQPDGIVSFGRADIYKSPNSASFDMCKNMLQFHLIRTNDLGREGTSSGPAADDHAGERARCNLQTWWRQSKGGWKCGRQNRHLCQVDDHVVRSLSAGRRAGSM